MPATPSATRPIAPISDARPGRRLRAALLAATWTAFALAASPAGGQPQPGEPTVSGPVADPHRAVAVEIAMRLEDGAVVCRPDRVRFPANEQLTLQLVNATPEPLAFTAPDFFLEGSVAALTAVRAGEIEGSYVVPADTVGRIVLETDGIGEYPFGCGAVGAAPTATGTIAIPD